MIKLQPELLTHPTIPKALHGLNPRTLKGQAWWNKTRQEAYKSTDYHCLACGVHKHSAKYHKWLEAHENYLYDYSTGRVEVQSIIPLCHSCHSFIHSQRLGMLLNIGQINYNKAFSIIQHGCNILSDNNLKGFNITIQFAEYLGCTNIPDSYVIDYSGVSWDKWHLILDGKSYTSNFKNENEWANSFK